MEPNPTISPELVALVDAGDGYAQVIDPTTNRVFVISEQTAKHPVEMPETEEELAAMLEVARRDLDEGRICTLSTQEILAEARRRAGISQ